MNAPYSGADVTVVIVNWNSGTHLKNCLLSLQTQTIPPAEVIVVDNASSDSSVDEADVSQAKLISLDENTGFAKANNVAIAATQTKWVATLNPDTQAKPGWIESLVAGANQFGENTMFACRQLKMADENTLDGTGDVYHVSGLAWRRDYGRKTVNHATAQPLFSPCAAAAMYPVDKVTAVGGFDEDYFCYFEDVDLAFRLRHKGVNCEYLEQAVVSHVGYASSGENSAFTLYHGHRNLVWTYVKNVPGNMIWMHLPQHIALNIFSVTYYACKGLFTGRFKIDAGSLFKAKVHAITGLRDAIRKRKSIMQDSQLNVAELKRCMQTTLLPRRKRAGV